MNSSALNLLNDEKQTESWLSELGVKNFERGKTNLLSIAKSGMTLDLLENLLEQVESHLPAVSDTDMALNNLEKFVLSARSPLALGALFQRDITAIPILLTLFSTSQYLSDLLIRDRESYDALRLSEGQPCTREILVKDLRRLLGPVEDTDIAMTLIRRFKHRESLRIAFGDLVAGQRIAEVTEQISFVADAICEAAFTFCQTALEKKWGVPRLANREPCRFAILAMGKLGGLELNYSSDIDLIMIYEGDGQCDGRRSRSNREFFEQLTRNFCKLLNEVTRLGGAYRVDLRLRPEGSKGRLCNTIEQMMRYYEMKGRTWERQALIKLRPVAGDLDLGQQLIQRIKPWVYRKRLSRLDISDIKVLKRKIERRALTEGMDRRNVKTGHGGIRDIEFAIQFLQLSYGGLLSDVREVNTLIAIEKLQAAGCLSMDEETLLSRNYGWLRKLEHRLQIMFDLQTHTLPESDEELQKVAIRMGYQDCFGKSALEQFHVDLAEVTEANRRILDHLLHHAFSDGSDAASDEVPIEADLVLDESPDEEMIERIFTDYGFSDPPRAQRHLVDLAKESTPFLSPHRCHHFLAAISNQLLTEISQTPDPDETLGSLAGVSETIGAKGVLWELFHRDLNFLQLYVRLCASSKYLTGILKRNPGMLDELVDALAVDSLPTFQWLMDHMADLVYGAEDIGPIVHSFKQAQHLRVGIRDIIGRDTIQQKHQALSDIAQVCLAAVTDHIYRKMLEKFGQPMIEGTDKTSQLVILGLGKLGGQEPNYHSDIDVVFLYEHVGRTRHPDPNRSTSNQHFFSELAAGITKFMTQSGSKGKLYEIDSRLRPTGASGSLAVSFDEFDRYFESGKGQLWERLALCKARVIYGNREPAMKALAQVEKALVEHGWKPGMAEDILHMRLRMQEGSAKSNLKRGEGGTVDVEFIVQMLQLKFGAQLPQLRVQGTLRAIAVLAHEGILTNTQGENLSYSYQLLRQVESGLRLMNRVARHDLPAEPEALKKLAYLLRFESWQKLVDEIELARAGNRKLLLELVKDHA